MRTTTLTRNHHPKPPAPARPAVEPLESRRLLTVAATALPAVSVAAPTSTAQSIDLGAYFVDPAVPANTVFMQTTLGTIPIQLTPGATPITVANFLNYVRSGRYDNTFFHRSVSNFVIQGGGFGIDASSSIVPVQTDPPIANEYSPSRLNTRGTIAMAKTSDPNSATSQFFFNLSDNTSSLNNTVNSGGFTVFGSVVGSAGLAVMDAIAAVPPQDASFVSPVFGELPLLNYQAGQQTLRLNQFIYVTGVTEGAAYTVASDNPAVVTAAVRGGQLLYTPVAAGTAHVTVTARGLDGHPVSQVLTVTVGQADTNPGGNTGGDTGNVDPPPAATAVIGKGGKKSVTFKDKDGTVATITLAGPGSATLNFDGTGASVRDAAKGAGTVVGSNLSLDSIVLAGTTNATVVTVTTRGGNGWITLGGLTAAGAAGTFDGNGVTLVGQTAVGRGIKSLTVRSAAITSRLAAGSIGSVTVTGVLQGIWTVGSVNTVSAGTISSATLATTGVGNSMGTVTTKAVTNSRILSAGNIRSFVVAGSVSGMQLFAGVPADGTATADDAANGRGDILSVKIGAAQRWSSFSQSAIAARSIKSGSVANLIDGGPTDAFCGIEADSIVSMTGLLNFKAFAIKNARTQAQADAQLAKTKAVSRHVKIVVV